MRATAWLALLFCAAAGCNDGGGTSDAGADARPDDSESDGGTDAAADIEPPEIREIAAMLGDPSPATLDLSSSDSVRVIVEAAPLTFRVFVRDDVTPTEDLEVELVDPVTDERLEEQTAELDSGLWRVQTTAAPGVSATVRAVDEAGNAVIWPHAAIFSSRAEALVREWTLLRYDEEGTVVSRRSSSWAEGTWCTEGEDGAELDPAGGSYAVDDADLLTVERRHRMACDVADYGTEWDSIEHARTAPFYVDATYLSDRPFVREGSGSGPEGTWTRSATVDDGSGPTELTETLVLEDDGSLRRELADGTMEQGTYELRETGGYEENFGDLLIETVDRVDGTDVTPETRVRFWVVRSGMLLVDPMVDTR